jgi:hypothetical protein
MNAYSPLIPNSSLFSSLSRLFAAKKLPPIPSKITPPFPAREARRHAAAGGPIQNRKTKIENPHDPFHLRNDRLARL